MDCRNPKSKLIMMLPQEILRDILTLLDIKLIGRCRCVSKTWQKLLSEPDFIRAHCDRTKHLTENKVLLFRSFRTETVFTARVDCELPDKFIFLATEVTFVTISLPGYHIPSCDGLILIMNNAGQTLLVNPTTKEVRELAAPLPGPDTPARFVEYDLGYDRVNDDYKVLSPSNYKYYLKEATLAMVVHVYSVRNNTWNEVACSAESFEHESDYIILNLEGVFVAGSVYWLATNAAGQTVFIVGFNLAEEKLRIIPVPRAVYGEKFVCECIRELSGCLCLLCFVSFEYEEFNVWVMKEYGVKQSWTKSTIVDEVGEWNLNVCAPWRRGVVLHKETDENAPWRRGVVLHKETDESDDFVIYNLDSATFKKITMRNGGMFDNCVGSFIETLVSPYYNYET